MTHLTDDPHHKALTRTVDRYLGRALPPMHCTDRLEPRWREIEAEVIDATEELRFREYLRDGK